MLSTTTAELWVSRMCVLADDTGIPKLPLTVNLPLVGEQPASCRRQSYVAESQSDCSDIENMVCAVQLLLIHHSKQEIMFLHPDKSSSRHSPNTSLVLSARNGNTGTYIYSQFMLSASVKDMSVICVIIRICVDVFWSTGATVPSKERQCLLSQLIN